MELVDTPSSGCSNAGQSFADRFGCELTKADYRAVFFGAGFGESDTYLTPLGEVYGVEAHAASFLSLLDPPRPVHHLLELLLDWLNGLLLGLLTAWCWNRYFEYRLSTDANRRQRAQRYVWWLGGGVLAVTVIFLAMSFCLLRSWGFWLAPIPIAIGMLIHSFSIGLADQAVRVANHLKGQGRPAPKSFAQSASRFFGGDCKRLWDQGKKPAAGWTGIRLVLWGVVVVLAVVSCFTH